MIGTFRIPDATFTSMYLRTNRDALVTAILVSAGLSEDLFPNVQILSVTAGSVIVSYRILVTEERAELVREAIANSTLNGVLAENMRKQGIEASITESKVDPVVVYRGGAVYDSVSTITHAHLYMHAKHPPLIEFSFLAS